MGAWWNPAGWWLVPFLGYAAVNVAVVSRVGWLGWWDWLGWAQRVVTFWLVLDVVGLPRPEVEFASGNRPASEVGAAAGGLGRSLPDEGEIEAGSGADRLVKKKPVRFRAGFVKSETGRRAGEPSAWSEAASLI